MKKLNVNLFTRVVALILLLLILIVFLYTYSNQVSIGVIQDEIKASNYKDLSFFLNQVDNHVERMSTNAILLTDDPAILELQYNNSLSETYDKQALIRMINGHISLQAVADGWSNDITVYSLYGHDIISTGARIDFQQKELISNIKHGWQYKPAADKGGNSLFEWYSVYPISAYSQPEKAKLIIQTSFSASNLVKLLDDYKAGGKGDPFFYNPKYGIIANHTANTQRINELTRDLNKETMITPQHEETNNISGRKYMIDSIKSKNLDWYLIDYIPLQEILSPITKSRNVFLISTALLLLLSIMASFLLYRHVQVPIAKLVKNMQRIKRGDYSARITHSGSNEFKFLFERFNEMAFQIQELIENVYIERIHSRDASLKQLQSQINPHFLYNCLSFIKGMASLGNEEAVIAMSLNLGEYFRYTTRVGNQTSTLREEIHFITNYLTIQNLRMKRIEYEIDIPEPMLECKLPRLLLQPIVENAIIYGVEPQSGTGSIQIYGEETEKEVSIIVEDNGRGITEEALQRLQHIVNLPADSEGSRGLWNVNQRLALQFGEGSGLRFEHAASGGLRVIMLWIK